MRSEYEAVVDETTLIRNSPSSLINADHCEPSLASCSTSPASLRTENWMEPSTISTVSVLPASPSMMNRSSSPAVTLPATLRSLRSSANSMVRVAPQRRASEAKVASSGDPLGTRRISACR